MFNNWKSLLSFDDGQGGPQPRATLSEDAQAHLRQTLADLRVTLDQPVTAAPSQIEEIAAPTNDAIAPNGAAADADGAFEAARRFLAEHRQTVESLMREFSAIEGSVNSQAEVNAALAEYTTARQRASETAIEEQRLKELLDEASDRHRTLMREREDASELVETVRAKAVTAKNELRELEERLRDAQQAVADKFAALDEHEGFAKDCAATEAAAASEAAAVEQRHTACRNARAAAEKEAQAAKDRAETLKEKSGVQTLSGFGDVHRLAIKIAQAAAELNPR